MATMRAAPGSALIGELLLCAVPLILRPVALPPQILDLVERVVQPGAQLDHFRRGSVYSRCNSLASTTQPPVSASRVAESRPALIERSSADLLRPAAFAVSAKVSCVTSPPRRGA